MEIQQALLLKYADAHLGEEGAGCFLVNRNEASIIFSVTEGFQDDLALCGLFLPLAQTLIFRVVLTFTVK